MKAVTVVGSGPSGVHFAQSLLQKGYRVRMVDAGAARGEPTAPDLSLNELKTSLPDSLAYFLGERFESAALPGEPGEYYGFPPHKRPIFDLPTDLRLRTSGFDPLFSHTPGGLAEAWTAGCYPFDDTDLASFPFGYRELAPHYEEVAKRIGVTGIEDDLAGYMPVHDGLLEPIDLDPHSADLLGRYARVRRQLHDGPGCYVGRSRVAALARDYEGRPGCTKLGRCLWGCPTGAFYTPTLTLDACLEHPEFEYVPGVYVRHFRFEGAGRISTLVGRRRSNGQTEEWPVETLALAAGTLSTTRIVLESVWLGRGERPELPGLMDNRQVLVPFVNLRRIPAAYEPDSYQYHQLSLGLEPVGDTGYVHGQITTLATAQAHPIVESIPLDGRAALWLFRNVRGALGLVNLNFADTRRDDCTVSIGDDGEDPPLRIRYRPCAREPDRIRDALRRLRRALRRLGCVVPPGTVHVRPMGASVHYAGTIPMTGSGEPMTATARCRSRDFENLYLIDGTTFPYLPAKNITFTLMANAVRVASEAF